MKLPVNIKVNGVAFQREVEPRLLLVHFLRELTGLTGTKVGCDTSQCGACTVLVDGLATKSCTRLAVQADGSAITTIEGLAHDGKLHQMQESFWAKHGLQCGFCTPGMILASIALLAAHTEADGRSRAPRPRGQLVPMHRLPEHRPRGLRRRGGGSTLMAARVFGSAIRRREDPRLITGTATYTDDLTLPGTLHAAILRSPHAHARITRIDTSKARSARWRRCGLHRRGHRIDSQADAVRLADSQFRTENRGIPAARERRRAIRRRLRRRRGCRESIPGAGRRRSHRRGLRPASRRRGSAEGGRCGGAPASCRCPRQSGVPLDRRGRRRRRRLRESGRHRQGPDHPAAADSDGHGTARGACAICGGHRRADRLEHDTEPAHPPLPRRRSSPAFPKTSCASSPRRSAADSAARSPRTRASFSRSSRR